MLKGFDVSNYQRGVDMTAAATSGQGFVVIEATQGLTFRQPYFYSQWQGARDAGLARGGHHFADPDNNLQRAS